MNLNVELRRFLNALAEAVSKSAHQQTGSLRSHRRTRIRARRTTKTRDEQMRCSPVPACPREVGKEFARVQQRSPGPDALPRND